MNYLNQQRSFFKKVWFSIALLATLFLSGCNGHKEEVVSEETVTGTEATASTEVRDALKNENNGCNT